MMKKELKHDKTTEICETCGLKFEGQANLINHMIGSVKVKCVKKKEERREIYSCNQCDYQTKRKHNLSRHEEKHKKPTCPLCNYQAKNGHNLNSHIRNLHEIYSCNQCDYQTSRKCDLGDHIKAVHDNTKKFLCSPVYVILRLRKRFFL